MNILANVESRRVFEVVSAFEECQITLHELEEVLRPLSSEALQVAVTFGSARDSSLPGAPRLQSARRIVRTLARASRCCS